MNKYKDRPSRLVTLHHNWHNWVVNIFVRDMVRAGLTVWQRHDTDGNIVVSVRDDEAVRAWDIVDQVAADVR